MTHHDKIAAWFDARVQDGTADAQERRFEDIASRVIGAMEVRPGQQLADLGCGTGWATKLLGKKAPGAQAVGFDVSPETIAKADADTDWTARARFERGTFEALDVPDGRFDHVLALDALEYAEDAGAALQAVAAKVKEGGRLEVVVRRFAESPATERYADEMGVALPWHTASEWESLVAEAGFTVESTERLNDSRDEVPFEVTPLVPDEAAHAAEVEAGVLWIRAVR